MLPPVGLPWPRPDIGESTSRRTSDSAADRHSGGNHKRFGGLKKATHHVGTKATGDAVSFLVEAFPASLECQLIVAIRIALQRCECLAASGSAFGPHAEPKATGPLPHDSRLGNSQCRPLGNDGQRVCTPEGAGCGLT